MCVDVCLMFVSVHGHLCVPAGGVGVGRVGAVGGDGMSVCVCVCA